MDERAVDREARKDREGLEGLFFEFLAALAFQNICLTLI
jgi:hypothetical protein